MGRPTDRHCPWTVGYHGSSKASWNDKYTNTQPIINLLSNIVTSRLHYALIICVSQVHKLQSSGSTKLNLVSTLNA